MIHFMNLTVKINFCRSSVECGAIIWHEDLYCPSCHWNSKPKCKWTNSSSLAIGKSIFDWTGVMCSTSVCRWNENIVAGSNEWMALLLMLRSIGTCCFRLRHVLFVFRLISFACLPYSFPGPFQGHHNCHIDGDLFVLRFVLYLLNRKPTNWCGSSSQSHRRRLLWQFLQTSRNVDRKQLMTSCPVWLMTGSAWTSM